ncbi:60Kd inner membrane protein-domain-containing protein [Limtongia smithiae]|uniref:60Kd inner membrane protein-domain-containing protein n=1 Tax=Limtongia smithiae TaxID=1125753 RepID=UPI0034CF8E91
MTLLRAGIAHTVMRASAPPSSMLLRGVRPFISVNARALPLSSLRPQNFLLRQVRSKSDIASAAATAATTVTSTNPDAVTTAASTLDVLAQTVPPDQIGYLQSLGLAQTWYWPSDVAAHMLEYVHVYTGLPWWSTIIVAAIGSRLIVLPLMLKSFEMNLRLKAIRPALNLLQAQTQKATNPQERVIASMRSRKLLQMNGVSMPLVFIGAVTQIPIAYGFFVALSSMSGIPVDGMTTGGALWFTNLAIPDPYLGLSLISGASLFVGFKMGGEMGSMSNLSPVMRTVMTYAPPAGMLLMGLWYSSANVLFFVVAGIMSMLQTMFCRSAFFRRMMGIPEEVYMQSFVNDKQQASKSITEQYKDMWNTAKKQAEDKAAASSSSNAPTTGSVSAKLVQPVRMARRGVVKAKRAKK